MQKRLLQRQANVGPSPTQTLVRVHELITELIENERSGLVSQEIRFELDLQPIEAKINVGLIKTVLTGLVKNAIETTPEGGEITITLIDSPHQWEVEVADSSNDGFLNDQTSTEIEESELPVLLTFPTTDHLRNAYKAAFDHGCAIQSWECPQGGLAYLLVVPRRNTHHQGIA